MQACQSDIFMAKAPEPGAPLKGANSFTEGQAKDRALAAGFTSVSSLVKDGDGIWRGTAMKDGKSRQGRRRLQGQRRQRIAIIEQGTDHEDHHTRL